LRMRHYCGARKHLRVCGTHSRRASLTRTFLKAHPHCHAAHRRGAGGRRTRSVRRSGLAAWPRGHSFRISLTSHGRVILHQE
jgi:hypothetical protein